MKGKTGRPVRSPIEDRPYHDLEKGTPIIVPGAVSYIYSGQWRTTDVTATMALTDQMVCLVDTTEGDIILTLPASASNTHKVFTIKKVDSSGNKIELKGNVADETIDGEDSIVIGSQYQYVTVICDGSDWYIIGGEYVKMEDLLSRMLEVQDETRDELKIVNKHLSEITDQEIDKEDINADN